MNSEQLWVFVDDLPEEAATFADHLGGGDRPVAISVLDPAEAREQLLSKRMPLAGVLMDVDLSAAEGERGTGPGIAQDLRVKQRAGAISEFPVVRLAGRLPVTRNVAGDPASDDLFDLKIQKEEVILDVSSVQRRLHGVREIYDFLSRSPLLDDSSLVEMLGLDLDGLRAWSHPSLQDRLASTRQTTSHVAAGAFLRGFLLTNGLLIDEAVLGFRLGVDRDASGAAWLALLQKLQPTMYRGVAHSDFRRWWARGLEDWWLDQFGPASNLAALDITERVERLSQCLELSGLAPLSMPVGSPGSRPWRVCQLSLEEEPPRWIPVDPSEAVRLTPRDDLPQWVDPLYAALGPALRAKDDLRLNRIDLDRLGRKHRATR